MIKNNQAKCQSGHSGKKYAELDLNKYSTRSLRVMESYKYWDHVCREYGEKSGQALSAYDRFDKVSEFVKEWQISGLADISERFTHEEIKGELNKRK